MDVRIPETTLSSSHSNFASCIILYLIIGIKNNNIWGLFFLATPCIGSELSLSSIDKLAKETVVDPRAEGPSHNNYYNKRVLHSA